VDFCAHWFPDPLLLPISRCRNVSVQITKFKSNVDQPHLVSGVPGKSSFERLVSCCLTDRDRPPIGPCNAPAAGKIKNIFGNLSYSRSVGLSYIHWFHRGRPADEGEGWWAWLTGVLKQSRTFDTLYLYEGVQNGDLWKDLTCLCHLTAWSQQSPTARGPAAEQLKTISTRIYVIL
jgi:hypothetical protein